MSGSIYNTIRPTYYADTINGSGVALSALVNPVTGQPVVPGVACYVADGDGSGNPVVWTCAVSTAAVDHSTVEAVAGATGCRWLKAGAFGGGDGGLTPIANDTMLGNVSGGAATPVALTPAQILSLLGITPYSSSALAALIRAQSLLGTQYTSIGGSDFYSSGDFSNTGTSGSGSVALSTADRGGVVLVSTGASAFGFGRMQMAGGGTQIDNVKTSKFYVGARMAISTAVDANSEAALRVIGQSGNTIFELGCRAATDATHFSVFVRDASSTTRTNVGTGVLLDTAYHTLEVWSDGTNLNFAIDGTTVNQTALSLLSAGEAAHFELLASNGSVAANRQVNADSVWVVVLPN